MKNPLRWIAVLAILAASGAAFAVWNGRFYCAQCTDNTTGSFANGETYIFIFTDVNQKVSNWMKNNEPGTVTICNGSKCALFQYIALSGQFKLKGYYTSLWNGASGNGTTGGGSPPPTRTWTFSSGTTSYNYCDYGCDDLYGTVGTPEPVPESPTHN